MMYKRCAVEEKPLDKRTKLWYDDKKSRGDDANAFEICQHNSDSEQYWYYR